MEFLNHYECPHCATDWQDEADCMCDDRCPTCNASCSPVDSDEIGADEEPVED